MAVKTVSILRAIGNPNKAKIIAHLAKHKGETAEGIGKHLGLSPTNSLQIPARA